MARRSIVEILISAKDATAGAFRGVFGGLNRLRQAVFSVRTAFAALSAFVVGTVIKNIVAAFGEQEDAIIRLNTALRVTGRFSEEATRKIQGMASEMQRLTTVADEAALAVSATVAQLATELTADQLADVQKAAIGLSQTFGLDLQQSAILVGKALAGERDILSRYGISLDTTATQQNRFNELMAKTAGFFDVAVGSTQSLRGQWTQAANEVGELKESIGQLIVEIFGLDRAGGTLRDRIRGLNEDLRENFGTWVKWGRIVVESVKAVGQSVWGLIRIVSSFGSLVGAELASLLISPFALASKALKTFADAWNEFATGKFSMFKIDTSKFEETIAIFDQTTNEIVYRTDEIKDAFGSIVDAWKNVGRELDKPVTLKVAPDISTRGGGANAPTQRDFTKEAREATTEASMLAQKFQLGLVTAEEFNEALAPLVDRMVELRNSGQVADEELIALAKSMKDLIDLNLEASTQPSFIDHWITAMEELQSVIDEWEKHLATTTLDALRNFTVSAAAAFAAVGQGGREGAAAFQAAMLSAVAAVASSFSELFAARAAAEIAAGIAEWPFGMQHFAAAAQYFAAAAAMAAIGGAFSAGASRAAGGGASSARAEEEQRSDDVSDTRGSTTIEVVGDPYLDMSNPAIADALAEALDEVGERRLTIRYRPVR